jgi:hypothetical protein
VFQGLLQLSIAIAFSCDDTFDSGKGKLIALEFRADGSDLLAVISERKKVGEALRM